MRIGKWTLRRRMLPPLQLAFLFVFAVALTACGGGTDSSQDARETSETATVTQPPTKPEQGPEDFFDELFAYYFKGQYGRAWELLHPGHQAVVSRSKFDECVGTGFPSGVEFEGVDVEEVYDEPINVPRIPEKSSKAVTLTLKASSAGQTESDTDTYHLIDVGGRWAWILETQDVAAYERGECPP